MEKKRLLIVTQEINPYLVFGEIGDICRQLPEYSQNRGMEIRVLMPRFGNINERRHRLHEVVRLSGINISIAKDDYPVVIKVASLPGARIQVYFLDNDDLFKNKSDFQTGKKEFSKDNIERMIFFCKGVFEVIRRFGWAPDIIHCHGWMTSLIPTYLKLHYKKDPIFAKSKAVYSLYQSSPNVLLGKDFLSRISMNGTDKDTGFKTTDVASLYKMAIDHADAIIIGTKKIETGLNKLLKADKKKPTLDYISGKDFLNSYHQLYLKLMGTSKNIPATTLSSKKVKKAI